MRRRDFIKTVGATLLFGCLGLKKLKAQDLIEEEKLSQVFTISYEFIGPGDKGEAKEGQFAFDKMAGTIQVVQDDAYPYWKTL